MATTPLVLHTGEAVVLMRIRLPMLHMEEHDLLGRPMEDTEPRDKEVTMGMDITLPLGDPTAGTEDSLRGDLMDTMLHKLMCPLE